MALGIEMLVAVSVNRTGHPKPRTTICILVLSKCPHYLAGVVALVTYLNEVNKKDPWKFEDNYATPLIGALATAFNRMAVAS
jgi:hypothetical protein